MGAEASRSRNGQKPLIMMLQPEGPEEKQCCQGSVGAQPPEKGLWDRRRRVKSTAIMCQNQDI